MASIGVRLIYTEMEKNAATKKSIFYFTSTHFRAAADNKRDAHRDREFIETEIGNEIEKMSSFFYSFQSCRCTERQSRKSRERDGDGDRDVFFIQLLSKLQKKKAAEIEIKADAQKESRERDGDRDNDGDRDVFFIQLLSKL